MAAHPVGSKIGLFFSRSFFHWPRFITGNERFDHFERGPWIMRSISPSHTSCDLMMLSDQIQRLLLQPLIIREPAANLFIVRLILAPTTRDNSSPPTPTRSTSPRLPWPATPASSAKSPRDRRTPLTNEHTSWLSPVHEKEVDGYTATAALSTPAIYKKLATKQEKQ